MSSSGGGGAGGGAGRGKKYQKLGKKKKDAVGDVKTTSSRPTTAKKTASETSSASSKMSSSTLETDLGSGSLTSSMNAGATGGPLIPQAAAESTPPAPGEEAPPPPDPVEPAPAGATAAPLLADSPPDSMPPVESSAVPAAPSAEPPPPAPPESAPSVEPSAPQQPVEETPAPALLKPEETPEVKETLRPSSAKSLRPSSATSVSSVSLPPPVPSAPSAPSAVPMVTIDEPPSSPRAPDSAPLSAQATPVRAPTLKKQESKQDSNQEAPKVEKESTLGDSSSGDKGRVFWHAQRAEWAAVEQTLRKLDKGSWELSATDDETGETVLMWAVRDNKLVIVERLLEYGLSANQKAKDGRTAVHFAAQFAKEEVLRLLLSKKADAGIVGGLKQQIALHLACLRTQSGLPLVQMLLKATRLGGNGGRTMADKDGCIPLMLAVLEGNPLSLKELLEKDPEAQVRCQRLDNGDTALHIACRSKDIDSIRTLVDAGADLNQKNKEGHTPLHLSAAEGDEAAVKYLHVMKADASILDKDHRSPLHMAAEKGYTRIVEILIDKFRSNVLARTKDGSTLMHVSSQFGHPETTLAFLKRGVPLHMPNKAGAVCLHAAAKRGHALVVKALLEKGADVNCRTKDKFTALHIAVEHCNPPVVETLLGFGAHVDVKGGEDEDTPLHIASRVKGGERCAEMLLKSGADVNNTNKRGETSLHTACRMGNLQMLKALLHEGGDPTQPCAQGNSPLHIASRHCRYEVAKEVLDHVTRSKGRADAVALVNLGNKEGETPLHYAAELTKDKARSEFEDTDLIKILLRTDGDMNMQTKYTLETPLHYCSRAGNEDVMLEIVRHLDYRIQLCVNKQTTNGWSPLLFASDSGQLAIVNILLQKHARVDVFDSKGFAGLHLAAKSNHANVVKALLDRNAFVNAKSKECFTPLHLAASEGHNDVVKLLVKQDMVEVDARTLNSKTPLHQAALKGHKTVCETLLDHGADAKATDNNGQTPLHLAAEHDRSDVVKMFLKKNDLVTLANADDKGFTCAHIAASKGSIAVIRELMRSNRAIICTAKTRTNGSTALHLAAQEGHTKVVKALIDAGASPSEENSEGMTALHLAAQNGHSPVLAVLKDKVELRTGSTKTGMTPLHIAALNGRMEFVQDMLSRVPANLPSQRPKDPVKELMSDYGFTPLHLAAQSGHENLVRFLVNSRGVKVEAATVKNGTIPLHLAAQNGMANVASLLLSKDTSQIKITDQQGRTALHHAANRGHYEVVALLVGQGADVNGKDNHLWSPLHFAAKAGHRSVVSLLVDSKACTENETKEKKIAMVYAAESNHIDVVSYLLRRKHNTDQLMEDWKFLYDMMVCSKINNFKTIEEFILVSPAPVETAAKLSKNFSLLSEKEKERAKDLINIGKYCETMCTDLVAIAASENGAAKLLKAVDHRGITLLDILIETEQKEVIAHPSVQRYLTDVWRGNLDWPTWKFFLYFVFCLIPPFSMIMSLPLPHRYHRIPMIKFIAFLISHIHLIVLFVIVAIEPNEMGYPYWTRHDLIPTFWEWILLVWLSGFLVSELTNPADRSGLGLFKILIIAVCAFGVIAHVASFAYELGSTNRLDGLFIRNQLFALATLISFVTFLDFLTFHHLFGPWTIIIRDLMMDMLRFLVILGIFMAGFTLQVRALYVPVYGDEKPNAIPKNKNLLDSFELLFFSLFGLIEPDNLPNIALSPHWTITLVKAVFGAYMIIALIVLINLLIAMMSDTYQRIQAESDTEWKFGRAKLIRNMNKTSSTPSPLILITQFCSNIRLIYRRHKGIPISQNEEEWVGDDEDGHVGDMHANQNTGLLKNIFNRNTQISPSAGIRRLSSTTRTSQALPSAIRGPTSIEVVVDWQNVISKYVSNQAMENSAVGGGDEEGGAGGRRGSTRSNGRRKSQVSTQGSTRALRQDSSADKP